MAWDWAIDGFKAGIVTVTGLIANHYRKPLYEWAREYVKLPEVVKNLKKSLEAAEIEVSILKSKQMSDFHTDPTPVFITNTKGELIYANPAWVKVMGYRDPDNAYGYRYMDIIHPDDIVRARQVQIELVEHSAPYEDMMKFKSKTGVVFSALVISEPVHDKNNVLIETVGRLHIVHEP